MGKSLILAITEAVSHKTNTDMQDLPPLHDFVDSDGLKMLVASDGFIKTTFLYANQKVTITSTGDGFDVTLN